MRTMICAVMLIAGPVAPALADAAGAQSCAAKLSPAAQSIYRAAAPEVRPDTDLPALLRSKVRPMVMSGQIPENVARPEAEHAGECLRLLKN